MKTSGLFTEFLNQAPIAFAYHEIICDKSGYPIDFKFLWVNRKFEQFAGMNREDIEGKKRTDLNPVIFEEEKKCLETFNEVAQNGGRKQIEHFCPLFEKWVALEIFSSQTGLFGIYIQDITEKINSQQKLREKTQKYETVLSSMISPVFVLDKNHCFVECYCKSEDNLLMPKKDFINKSINEILPENIVDLYLQAANQVEKSGKTETINYNLPVKGITNYFNTTIDLHTDGESFVVSVHNITNQKKAEEKIREIETYFNFFLKQSIEGFYFTSFKVPQTWNNKIDKEAVLRYAEKNQIIVSVNQAFADQYGQKPSDLIGMPIAQIFDHDPETGRKARKQLFDERYLRLTTREKKKDSTEIWIEGEYMCVYNDEGKITGTIGAQKDVTKRIKATNELKESEERFRKLAESNVTGIGIYQDDHWIYTNPSFQKASGYTEAEMLKMKYWDFTAPEFKEKVKKIGQLRLKGETTINSYETKVYTKGNEERWVFVQGSTIKINGRPAGLISVIDITERAKMLAALKISEDRWKYALEGAGDGVWDWNLQTDYVYFSDQWKKMLGYNPEEISSKVYEWEKRVHQDDKKKTFKEIEKHLKGKNGSLFQQTPGSM